MLKLSEKYEFVPAEDQRSKKPGNGTAGVLFLAATCGLRIDYFAPSAPCRHPPSADSILVRCLCKRPG